MPFEVSDVMMRAPHWIKQQLLWTDLNYNKKSFVDKIHVKIENILGFFFHIYSLESFIGVVNNTKATFVVFIYLASFYFERTVVCCLLAADFYWNCNLRHVSFLRWSIFRAISLLLILVNCCQCYCWPACLYSHGASVTIIVDSYGAVSWRNENHVR